VETRENEGYPSSPRNSKVKMNKKENRVFLSRGREKKVSSQGSPSIWEGLEGGKTEGAALKRNSGLSSEPIDRKNWRTKVTDTIHRKPQRIHDNFLQKNRSKLGWR